MKKLTDEDPMPFGKYRDEPLYSVPASYFHWLWHNGLSTDRGSAVHQYILDSWDALVADTPDLIWEES